MITTDLLEFHAFCLTNTGTRLDQFAAALASTVRPGDTVLDLGAGLGILSVLACRAGAAHVLAVEGSPAADLGVQLVRHAGLSDRITFVRGLSFDLPATSRVDVIVADIHAPFGLQESGLSALLDARDRLLVPGGRLVPGRLTLAAAPVEASASYGRHIDVWRRDVGGLNLAPMLETAVNRPYPARLTPDDLLSPMVNVADIDLDTTTALRLGGRFATTATRAGLLHGVCCAFTSTLAAGITLRNAPGDAGTTNFAHALLPVATPMPVSAGDHIDVSLDIFDGIEFRWRVAVTHPGEDTRVAAQSTLLSWPLSPAALARESDGYQPTLNDRGRVERDLLSLIDGTRTAADLRAWLDTHAAATAPSARARAALLKETIARCG